MKTAIAYADYIDRLCTIEMRSSRIIPGTLLQLYKEARELQGLPLTYLAANRMIQTIRPDDNVIIASGLGGPNNYLPYGETDGPLGAAALARIIKFLLKANPIIVSGQKYIEPILASCQALGLSSDNLLSETAPFNDDKARAKGTELLEKYNPSALIAVEALGPNNKGVAHSLRGIDLTPWNVPFYHMFDMANQKGVLTIGIGDGGNEIGCGLIYENARKILKYGMLCQCPCKNGVATVTETDVLVLGGTSNWGAYGIEACLSILLRNPSSIHTPKEEAKSLKSCIDAGARDGPTGSSDLMVDAIPLETNKALITMLRTIAQKALE